MFSAQFKTRVFLFRFPVTVMTHNLPHYRKKFSGPLSQKLYIMLGILKFVSRITRKAYGFVPCLTAKIL